jgi:hypothetical protein
MFRLRSKILLGWIEFAPEGATRRLAEAEIISKITAKNRAKAVNEPKTEARKFLKKFIE